MLQGVYWPSSFTFSSDYQILPSSLCTDNRSLSGFFLSFFFALQPRTRSVAIWKKKKGKMFPGYFWTLTKLLASRFAQVWTPLQCLNKATERGRPSTWVVKKSSLTIQCPSVRNFTPALLFFCSVLPAFLRESQAYKGKELLFEFVYFLSL